MGVILYLLFIYLFSLFFKFHINNSRYSGKGILHMPKILKNRSRQERMVKTLSQRLRGPHGQNVCA